MPRDSHAPGDAEDPSSPASSNRGSIGSPTSLSHGLSQLVIEPGRYGTPPGAKDTTLMISGTDFGISGCSKEDFLQLNIKVNRMFDRVENMSGRTSPTSSEEDFCNELDAGIDRLFEDFEHLRDLLVEHQEAEAVPGHVEAEVRTLKGRVEQLLTDLDHKEEERKYAAWNGGKDKRSSRRVKFQSWVSGPIPEPDHVC